jgi:peptide/nickel transport system substrate-binding protein
LAVIDLGGHRVEWRAISDQQQAVNALLANEIDFIETPPHDLLPLAEADPNVKAVEWNVLGNQFTFRPNWLHKPFDNPKVRQALFYAFNQEDFLKAAIGDPEYYKLCKSYFPCGSALSSEKGMEGLLRSDFKKAQELLKEAGYDGTPIVLMHSTDLYVPTNLAPVAKSLMEKAGFKVDMQSMDWQTLVAGRAKRGPPNAGGWNAFLTGWVSADITNPIFTGFLNSACDQAMFGWPCDPEMEKLRNQFARETDPVKQKAIAEAVQVQATKMVPHIPLGQWYQRSLMRKNLVGMLQAPAPVFWNMEMQ